MVSPAELYLWYVADRVNAGWSPQDVSEYKEAVRAEMKSDDGRQRAIEFWKMKHAAGQNAAGH